jgi:hypothetical protein
VQDLMAGSPSESRSTTPADEDKREPILLPIIAPKRIPSPIQVIPSPPKILKRRRSVAFQAEDEIEDAPAVCLLAPTFLIFRLTHKLKRDIHTLVAFRSYLS